MKNVKAWMMVVVVICICSIANAQDRIERFNQFRAKLAIEEEERENRIEQYINGDEKKKVIALSEGRKAYLFDVINGKPVYMTTDNSDAAQNMGVSALRPGGSLGINLTGAGLRLHVWDGPGGARNTHQEFVDRITLGSDAGGGFNNHATHVTGSILSGGVNEDARGMAFEANGVVYDFNSDLTEMTEELENNRETMILSNHSYGPPSGWETGDSGWTWFGDENISNTEDWKFGFYDSRARSYDELVFDAPYYLIVKSAGNHRADAGDGTIPADGPYDVIPFQGVAKNIVTVAAIRKLSNGTYEEPGDVQITSFSSFGPTDDGRIKPDIAAPGAQIFSTWATNNESYSNLQGTSMSTPLVMGTLALIQELNQRINGTFLTAAQLKALMIHHAHEAGDADGPDYEYGWGLINAEGMAGFLLQENNDNIDLIAGEIADGETKTYTITPMEGTQVKLTLVWTDVPGTPTNARLDPEDLMLVNDLDMRAVGATETQEPWILTPQQPTRAAEKGDNFRDNVEKIEFSAVDDTYTINITHKDNIGEGPQKYALVIEYVSENAPKTLYWVGNSGDWNNGANWSLTSGGEAADMVPAATDIVIFDNNSFTGLEPEVEYAVTLSQDVEVAQFRWFAEKAGTFDLGGNNITSDGDLVVLTDLVNLNNGTFTLSGDNGDALVNVEAAIPGSDVVINSPDDATFQIVGDFSGNSLQLIKGTLNITGGNLALNNLTISGGTLNIANTALALGNSFAIEDETVNVTWTDSQMNVAEGSTATINLAGANLPIELTVAGNATITSAEEIKSLTNTGTTTIDNDLRLTDMAMGAGSSLNLGAGSTLTVAGMFDLSGTEDSSVAFASAGTAELDVENHRKICTDFVDVNGVNYIGQATLSIGTNSQLAGSESGWQQKACDDILFADFNFSFGCVNGLTQFENLSSGDVQSSAWNFGESDPSTVDSEESNPTYTYTSAGAKSIKLTVTDSESNTFELTANTEIIDNTIGRFNIVEQVGFLVSQRAGESYQWFKDGQQIEGETTRQLQATDAGTYNILVFDGSCNRFSEDFVLTVTSIEPDPEEQAKVEEAVNIFPNPTRDYIDVAVEGYNLRSLSMELVDQSGKVVTTSNHQNINRNSFTERLKVADKRQGFYILRFVVNENIIINRKVILTD